MTPRRRRLAQLPRGPTDDRDAAGALPGPIERLPGRPGARAYRRILTVEANQPGAGLEVIDRAVEAVREAEARREAA